MYVNIYVCVNYVCVNYVCVCMCGCNCTCVHVCVCGTCENARVGTTQSWPWVTTQYTHQDLGAIITSENVGASVREYICRTWSIWPTSLSSECG